MAWFPGDRIVGLLLLASVFTPVVAMLVVRGPRGALWFLLAGLLAADYLLIKEVDRRLAARRRAREAMLSPALVAEAGRYGLTIGAGDELVRPEWNRLKLVRQPILLARTTLLGTLSGTVRGHEVALLQFESARSELEYGSVGLVRLQREVDPLTISPRDTTLRKIAHDPNVAFDTLFKVKGPGAPAVSAPLQVWLAENARSFSFEIAGDWAACQWQPGQQIEAEHIGVFLSALVNLAERVELRG